MMSARSGLKPGMLPRSFSGVFRTRFKLAANLLPVLRGDRPAAARATRKLFQEFALKLAELWRYESGVVVEGRR